jgi:hypothetical protein
MNIIKSLFAFLVMLVATLLTASHAQAFALENHAGGFFLGTLDCAGLDGLGTRNPCRENGWLNYDTLSGCSVATNKGLGGNPFKGKTSEQIDEMFKKKGFKPRGPDPVSGKGGYVNPKTDRSYHIDEANSFGEPPHVDVNRPRDYKGPLEKKKLPMGDG